jgi:hypothetical protein
VQPLGLRFVPNLGPSFVWIARNAARYPAGKKASAASTRCGSSSKKGSQIELEKNPKNPARQQSRLAWDRHSGFANLSRPQIGSLQGLRRETPTGGGWRQGFPSFMRCTRYLTEIGEQTIKLTNFRGCDRDPPVR